MKEIWKILYRCRNIIACCNVY